MYLQFNLLVRLRSPLGILSLISFTSSPSRPAPFTHSMRLSHVQGTESSDSLSSSSSLPSHVSKTARMNSSSSVWSFRSFLTVGRHFSSLCAKSVHWVDLCVVIQSMILSCLLEPSLLSMLISSFMVGLGPAKCILLHVNYSVITLI